MISYIPFLKAKRGELTAMAELAPKALASATPVISAKVSIFFMYSSHG